MAIAIQGGGVTASRVVQFEHVVSSSAQGKGQDWGADGGVVVPLRLNGGNDEIIGVVAARQEDADQRFVVVDISLGDRGVHEPQVAERASEGGGAHGGTGGLADEFAAGLE